MIPIANVIAAAGVTLVGTSGVFAQSAAAFRGAAPLAPAVRAVRRRERPPRTERTLQRFRLVLLPPPRSCLPWDHLKSPETNSCEAGRRSLHKVRFSQDNAGIR